MAASEEIKKKILSDHDFVNLKRYGYSVEKVLDRFPDGAPTKLIAQGLMMSEEEVEEMLQSVILKLRSALKVEVEA
jgi:glycerol-3-phosphate responsive antiterminator